MSSQNEYSAEYAKIQDAQDPLRHLRDDFIIPTRADLKRKTLAEDSSTASEPSTYLCGNSLGLQPRLTSKYLNSYLSAWATKGVLGHFTEIEDSPLAPWLHVDDDVMEPMARIVGAKREEVAVMETLTANLHLLMCSFYRPTKDRWKVLIEGKAFPSDHYAVESQIQHHDLDPASAMVLIEPPDPSSPLLSTSHILATIDEHASETALLLLPGIQFYTGQFFDMKTITAHAHERGIVVGWDLAHAVGNVPLQLHNWNVDFAAWCNYKYMNCGPGAIGGLFVHEKHSGVSAGQENATTDGKTPSYRPRLSGWWGNDKSSRFRMENRFVPIPGAGGFQLSNPSVADLAAVRASLDTHAKTTMLDLRSKSVKLTAYLQQLLLEHGPKERCYEIITPLNPEERGAQLSLKLREGLLESVMEHLEEEGVVVDERRPDVIRVAPAPLYNNYSDVLRFVQVFRAACERAAKGGSAETNSLMVNGGREEKGWGDVK
ncbi:Kynureninase (L-kynurenine hydrolase) [Elasticomyces elasticus]|nr:Kynureninase (L-kynurenine hydrolase) [Elasticomyces elasticus]KAK5010954.1 Kynureninase 1 [Elasticomyces elasticus]